MILFGENLAEGFLRSLGHKDIGGYCFLLLSFFLLKKPLDLLLYWSI